MKWYSVLGKILAVLIVIAAVVGIIATESVEEIPVYNKAVIRLPGEFSGEVKYLYNEFFVIQDYEGDSAIKLEFEKEGYYHILLGGKQYIFVYNPSVDNYKYDLDLIENEYRQIKSNIFMNFFVITIIIEVVALSIYFVAALIISAIRNTKGKAYISKQRRKS